MGKEEQLKNELCGAIIQFMRANHPETIDKAYSYFWDDLNPDEFLGGVALDIGFLNFEDWLMFDHRPEGDRTVIDLFMGSREGLADDAIGLLNRLKDSYLSLYRVESVAKDKRVLIKDLFLGSEHSLRDKALSREIKKGEIFAARLLSLDGGEVMSGCVYPFRADLKQTVFDHVEHQFGRYIKNENPSGSMRDFLKRYGETFNLIWMELVMNPRTPRCQAPAR